MSNRNRYNYSEKSGKAYTTVPIITVLRRYKCSFSTDMGTIKLTFHDDLVDFLAKDSSGSTITYAFCQKIAVKHIIEALGVPHPEIGRIECDHREVPLGYAVQDGDDIHIYPVTPGDYPYNGNQPRYILDNHLGKLADYLRLLGFDAVYARDWPDHEIARAAQEQKRILLTRDRGLLKRKIVTIGHCVRADDPIDQLAEVVALYNLKPLIKPFQRCPRCNGNLIPVEKEQIIDQLLPLTRKYYFEFTRCDSCGQIYWKGSHYDHMRKLLAAYIGTAPEEQ